MKFDLVTVFPGMVEAALAEGVVSRGIATGVLDVSVVDLRDHTTDRHRSVDDVPYGGGPGMVMKPEPLVRAVEDLRRRRGTPDAVILLSPQGTRFTQAEAGRLSGLRHIVLLCGRYEGMDERVPELVGAEEISLGDFVERGGELPAMFILDAVSRLVPGVVGDGQLGAEDLVAGGLVACPHYTRPAEFAGVKVREGDKERIQIFEGIIIGLHRGGARASFTVRKVSFGQGVERIFPLHSPIIAKVDVVRSARVRRAKLYFLRDLKGKAARMKESTTKKSQ